MRQANLNEAVNWIIVKQNVKSPIINLIPVEKLSAGFATLASKLFGKSVKEGGIVLSKKDLTHTSPKRKEAYGHAFRIDKIRQIVGCTGQ